jgi:excisionase family DNA binding protein
MTNDKVIHGIPTLGLSGAAEAIGVHRQTMWRLVKEGRVPAFFSKLAHRKVWRIPKDALERERQRILNELQNFDGKEKTPASGVDAEAGRG